MMCLLKQSCITIKNIIGSVLITDVYVPLLISPRLAVGECYAYEHFSFKMYANYKPRITSYHILQ